MNNSPLLLDSIEIRQDTQGRFCLNDLHKAAGGLAKHQPAYWTRQAEDLIMASSNSSNMKSLISKSGKYGGTFASEDLVYAYAMWISPEFQLEVIHAYKALQKAPEPQALMSPAEMQLAQCNLIVNIEKRQDTQELVLEE